MAAAVRLAPTRPQLVPYQPDPAMDWAIPFPAVVTLAQLEGCTLKVYVCPAGVPTNGLGETEGVTMDTPDWTLDYAVKRFQASIAERAAAVRRMVTVALNPFQLGALVLLVYNIGEGNFQKSTVLRQLNAGNYNAAGMAFGLFDQIRDATGKLVVSDGLVARRKHEQAIFFTPIPDEGHVASPQEVAPESSPAASPINQAGVVTVGTGALSLLSGLGDNASKATDALSAVGANADKATTALTQVQGAAHGFRAVLAEFDIPPGIAIGSVGLVAGVVVLYFRRRQRNAGRA